MENKKLDLILIGIAIVLVLIISYMIYLISHNENSRIYFNHNDIKNITWKNEEEQVLFKLDGKNASLKIQDKEILLNNEYDLNLKTGEITYKVDDQIITEQLYIRSVTEEDLVIWYNRAEYRLTKEKIAK